MQSRRKFAKRPDVRFVGDEHCYMKIVKARTPFNFGHIISRSQDEVRFNGTENMPELDANFRPVRRGDAEAGARQARLEVMDADKLPLYGKKTGIRVDVLLIAVLVLVVTLYGGWLLDHSRIDGLSKDLSAIDRSIKMTANEIVVMDEQYNQAVADIDMVRYAVEKLGMISTGGANRVMLVVPADVVEGPVTAVDGVTTQFATIQGNP